MSGTLKLLVPLFLLPLARTGVPCSRRGFYEDENDIVAYYRCDGSNQTHHHCPPGTTFDVNRLACRGGNSKTVRTRRSTKDELKIVCYYINWGIYREGVGKFEPENTDPFLCTHIIYAFAKLDNISLRMATADKWVDIDLGSYKVNMETETLQRVLALKKKNPKLRILLAIGGWMDSKGDKYSRLVSDSQHRKNFTTHAVSFLKQHEFDGLDIDWEFPVCWHADCSSGPKSDKDDFSDFIKELRKAFDNENPKLLLTAAVSASKYIAKNSYDIKSLGKYLDFINVMAYDYHSASDGRTGHHAAFRVAKKGPKDGGNVVSSMKYWEEHGAPKKKLILGVPAYGRTFRLANAQEHGLYASTTGPGEAGKYSKEAGSLAYYEILEKLKNRGWKMERDYDAGPYAYGEGQWVGYDDPVSCKEKARYARDYGYGGVMIWDLAAEDFNAKWSERKYPLLNSFKEGFVSQGSGTIWKGNGLLCLAAVILIAKSSMETLNII